MQRCAGRRFILRTPAATAGARSGRRRGSCGALPVHDAKWPLRSRDADLSPDHAQGSTRTCDSQVDSNQHARAGHLGGSPIGPTPSEDPSSTWLRETSCLADAHVRCCPVRGTLWGQRSPFERPSPRGRRRPGRDPAADTDSGPTAAWSGTPARQRHGRALRLDCGMVGRTQSAHARK